MSEINRIYGWAAKSLTSYGTILKVVNKHLPSFDDPTKIAMAWHALLQTSDGSIVKYWFNTYQPSDESELPGVGECVKFDKTWTKTTEEKFDKIAASKGYQVVDEQNWPPQCKEVLAASVS